MGIEQSVLDPTGEFKFSNTACRIVVVAPKNGDDCLVELANLPQEARILSIGSNLEEIRKDGPYFSEANVLLNVSGNATILAEIINELPFLCWIHSMSAGVEHILCPEIVGNDDIYLTNAKGVFSSSLGEYVLFACNYFAKNLPLLMEQKAQKIWNKFCVSELKGKTMGIIGYGDIGLACAKLAKAHGMEVIALRRYPNLSNGDPYCDKAYSPEFVNDVISQSDYLVLSMPLTPQTKHFIKAENLIHAKKDMILINVGRGELIEDDALIAALKTGIIKGAALDVFSVEPLPVESEYWSLPNVLLSPHNADLLIDSRHKSIRFFTENCKNFLAGEDLMCIVNKKLGY